MTDPIDASQDTALKAALTAYADPVRLDILDVLWAAGGPVSQREIRRRVKRSRGGLTYQLTQLQDAGIIEKVAVPAGRDPEWSVTPGAVSWEQGATDPDLSLLVEVLDRLALQQRVDRMRAWLTKRRSTGWASAWIHNSPWRDYRLRLTPEELHEMEVRIHAAISEVRTAAQARRESEGPGEEKPVFLVVAGFPYEPGEPA